MLRAEFAKGMFMRFKSLILASALAASPASAAPDLSAAVKADYDKQLGALFDWFHRNPELSFKETKTAARMAKELRAIPGMTVTEGVGGTGGRAPPARASARFGQPHSLRL